MSRAVIDQPGARIAIIGLILSFCLGFLLKSQMTPARIQTQLQKVVSRLEKDFVVDFEEAHVNLSNWGLPWPRLEINRVRLSPKKTICQASQVFIEQIEIPISWTALLFSQNAVEAVRAHQVELRIGDLDDCLNADKVSAKVDQDLAPPDQSVTGVNLTSTGENIFQRRTNSLLKDIYIDQLKIILKNQFQQPIVLRQLNVNLEYVKQNLSQINIKSRILALNDPKSGVFYLVGELTGAVKASENKLIEAQINLKGRMLDGDLQLFSQFNSVANKLTYEVSTKRVSAKAFLPLVKLDGFEAVFEKWPVNVTFDVTGVTDFASSDPFIAVKVGQFEMSGARTKMVARDLQLEIKNKQFSINSFVMLIDRLPLNQFKNIPTLKNDLNSFEDLGDIRAEVNFINPKNWTMDGSLLNTSFIFSNRGTRELQKIDSVQFHSTHKAGEHQLLFTEFKVNDQIIQGQLEAEFNERSNSLNAKMNLSGQLLNPKIWQQLTQIEQAPDVKMTWSYKKSGDLRQQVYLSAPEISFEGYTIKDLQIDFIQAQANADDQSLVLNMKAKEAKINVAKLNDTSTSAIFSAESGLQEAEYIAHKLHLNLKGSSWKNMSFDFDMGLASVGDTIQNAELKAKGQWKNDDTLDAGATLQNGTRIIKYNMTKSVQNNDVILTPVKTQSSQPTQQ